ncbi:type II toxin-antitoxin system VapB family antitoxin [Streptomyces sp. NPDC018972]|uniref:type II toxin-antitoxin system VapB family antitoxin n=1 Tax=Streptomyces sp. NPDC018972 TaxID=3365060 RepID=UPI00378C6B89
MTDLDDQLFAGVAKALGTRRPAPRTGAHRARTAASEDPFDLGVFDGKATYSR